MKEKPDLVNAPEGFIWSWKGKSVAHLVSDVSPFKGILVAVCGQRVRGKGSTVASQVGGYSAYPCQRCRQKVRLE